MSFYYYPMTSHDNNHNHSHINGSIIPNCPTPNNFEDKLPSSMDSHDGKNNSNSSSSKVPKSLISTPSSVHIKVHEPIEYFGPHLPSYYSNNNNNNNNSSSNNNNNVATTGTNTTTSTTPSSSTTSQPLSPPLSPYQRNAELNKPIQLPQFTDNETKTEHPKPVHQHKPSFLNNGKEFKLENFKDYILTVNIKPTKKYYNHQFEFLDKYSTNASIENKNYIASLPTRRYKKRLNYDSNDELTEDNTTTVTRGTRTRRLPKSYEDSDLDSSSLPSPKKRRRPNNTPGNATSGSSTPIPIAIQQQMLIDESIPDYSPDAQATLPASNSKCLKIEWKGQPMDLSQDPNLSKYPNLHPAEIVLASILRLPIAVYMDSKRRFFFEKVNKIKSGKTFRRTDAQKACRIDVNKASRLYAAFEKVGWLEDELFEKYL
ncbi:hypothetical protein CORT_0C06510 [Candida orthopsilosis Co 90-125]|uniref:SWIRM domain-containing protein n=1 Tax=Candida orthopsilosis (strain 90-125) TaxID=1136231 RepID=H8X472_CANO9|nr:hypothetical protein CORT_0C06510 [Candida orthopsilosis Co 90-125]CCG26024.1 hypothetical protein CORT_0C06510 [Candida orthopsilosis Co 90-125]